MESRTAILSEDVHTEVLEEVQRAIKELDFDKIHKMYWEQNECLFLERFLSPSVVERYFLPEVEKVRPELHRNYIPKHKKGGSVSYFIMREKAPAFMALYRSPDFIQLISRLVGAPVMLCPEDDPHACALYFYTEPGDHIGFHYDRSYYKGARYTILLGLVQKSDQCKLVCHLYKDDPKREMQKLVLSTKPGSMVVFNGNKLYHAVTPLEEGAERIMLTMEYVTNPEMGAFKRFVSNMKDAIAYFGFSTILGDRRRRP